MSDHLDRLRAALEAGPDMPWFSASGISDRFQPKDAAYIAAADPSTIRELLSERDALAAVAERLDGAVAAQVRLSHKPVTNPMYPKPLCNWDGEEWPCLTELQVVEGLYQGRTAYDRTVAKP